MTGLVRLGLSPRVPGLSREQAQRHWRGVHAALFARVPGVRSYVQNHAVLDARGEPLLGDPGFDIFSEVEFASDEDMAQAMASRWYRLQVIPDEKQLLDASRRCFLVTQRRAGTPSAAPGDCRLVLFVAGAVNDAREGVVRYDVQSAGGPAPRHLDTVLARWCASPQEAVRLHDTWVRELSDQGARVEAAVVAREHVVVPRKQAKAAS